MGRKKVYKSVIALKNEIEYSKNLIVGLIMTIETFQKISSIPNFIQLENLLEEHKILLKFEKKRVNSIYELGFVRLFASFESFMYEFIKELYNKYPNSLPKDKKIEIEYILDWPTKKSIKDFIVDHVSIENSYDLQTWEKTLSKVFGINIFADKKESEALFVFNLYRNMLVHSGGKFNSKIILDHAKQFGWTKTEKGKPAKFKVSKMDFDWKKTFEALIGLFIKIISNIENHCS